MFQIFLNGIIIGSIYALIALGFIITYSTTKFLNFSHGAAIVISAYAFAILYQYIGFVGAFLTACLFSILFNVITYLLIYKRMLYKKTSKVIMLLVSFGIMIGVEAIIQIIFSASPRRVSIPINIGIDFFDAIVTPIQIGIIIVTLLILCTAYLIIKKTRVGLGIRAISQNKELSEIYGINSEKIILNSFIIAGLLASIAAVAIALEYVITPTLGTHYMIKGFAASVTGGLSTIYGSVFGGYVIGLLENYGAWYFSSSFKDAIAFFVLFLILLIKPEGLFGIRKGVRG